MFAWCARSSSFRHLARRPIELELALGDAAGEGLLQELRERVVGDDVPVPCATEVLRGCVANDLATDPVDDDDAVDRLIERADQPVLRRFRLGHSIIRILFRLFDCRRERSAVGNAERAPRRAQFVTARDRPEQQHESDAPADDRTDDQKPVHVYAGTASVSAISRIVR